MAVHLHRALPNSVGRSLCSRTDMQEILSALSSLDAVRELSLTGEYAHRPVSDEQRRRSEPQEVEHIHCGIAACG